MNVFLWRDRYTDYTTRFQMMSLEAEWQMNNCALELVPRGTNRSNLLSEYRPICSEKEIKERLAELKPLTYNEEQAILADMLREDYHWNRKNV